MDQTIIGIIMLVAGLASIIFRRNWAQFYAGLQKESVNITLSKQALKKEERVAIIGGAILLVLGLLTLVGITKWDG